MTPKEHYDKYLADIYSWMVGDFEVAVSAHREFFEKGNIHPGKDGIALDLGAGTGIQSIALAQCGFKVLAVDFNRSLLNELDRTKGELPIRSIESDMVTYVKGYDQSAELVVCMGDTLTHLQNEREVEALIRSISAILPQGGKVVISYRDLSVEKKREDRIFLVRSDDSRSLTCFLEYFPDYVMVHDIIVEKSGPAWRQKVGAYPKLRLPIQTVTNMLRQNNLSPLREELWRGMSTIIAEKD